MTVSDYITGQVREALGPVNRWYCAQRYGREITDPEALLRHYITHGGASGFAREHAVQATSSRSLARMP